MNIDLDSPLVEEFIKKKAGPNAYPVVKTIEKEKTKEEKEIAREKKNGEETEENLNTSRPGQEGRTDEEIKKEVDIDDVNKIRSVLNRLHYLGIIGYDREKAEKSNWYTYTWFLREERLKELLKETYEEKLEELRKKLEMAQNYVFFKCENGCEEHPFEIAFEYDFECPDCGEQMDKADENNEEEIKEEIEEIKDLLGK